MKVLTLKQDPRKKTVKVFDSKTGTENKTESEKLVSLRYNSLEFLLQRKFGRKINNY